MPFTSSHSGRRTGNSDDRQQPWRVALAVVSGQAIEYYDFLLYASAAALVLGPAYFPTAEPATSTAAAFATFAIGFVMRPVGALIFGHLGDRVGRRKTLLLTLLLMGGATTLIGALPTYAQVGVAAPIALVTLRCIQGIAIGGEWGGAALLAVEHAPAGKRALWGSLPQLGSPIGLLMSTFALLAASQLPSEQFQAWGWRLPFLLTALLMALGARARLLVTESPEFSVDATRPHRSTPFVAVLRSAPLPVVAGLGAAVVTTAGYYLVNTFTISYVVEELGLGRDVGLIGQIVTGCVQVALVPVAGLFALRGMPERLAAASAVLVTLWAFPLYALMQTGAPAAIWVSQGVATVFLTGVWALLPEILAAQFPVHVRYTGISLCVQGASILGGLAPLAASRLVGLPAGPWLVAGLLGTVGLVSAAGVIACARTRQPVGDVVPIPRPRAAAKTGSALTEEV